MDFNYEFGKLPNNSNLLRRINVASRILFKKLQKYDIVQNSNISDYNKRYFGDKISSNKAIIKNLQKYSYILAWSLANIDQPLKKIVFMDYGGGHGMLALLAKALGIGIVIHNDLYEISCIDAKLIGEDLDLAADFYVPGDINDIILFRKNKNININVIANYDVIEHIYDIEDFLNKLTLLSDSFQSAFLASGANELNPFIRRSLQKQHLLFEREDRGPKYGRKPTDETRALIRVRKEIILSVNHNLKEHEVNQLVNFSRGLLIEDIKRAVIEYTNTQVLPPEPNHPTNTCDPLTGNWFEHLMDPFQLKNVLKKNGYKSEVIAGYYGISNNITYNMIKPILNLIIANSGTFGLRLAPFYAIAGFKSNKLNEQTQ